MQRLEGAVDLLPGVVVEGTVAWHLRNIEDEVLAAGCPNGAGVSGGEERVESGGIEQLDQQMRTAVSSRSRTHCLFARERWRRLRGSSSEKIYRSRDVSRGT